MKRRLLKLAVFVLLGAIANVAVAWGLILSGGIGKQRTSPDRIFVDAAEKQFLAWSNYAPADFGRHPESGNQSDPLGVTYLDFYLQAGSIREVQEHGVLRFAGLPMASLVGYSFSRLDVGAPQWTLRANTFMQVPAGEPTTDADDVYLPLRPIWPGFAINTVFYAVVVWLLFAGPFVVRRWRRIRRGLCPKCAYDLRGSDSPSCPECGATR